MQPWAESERSFPQKATKKTDKPRAEEEEEVTDLTDENLRQQLAKYGVDTGPIVGKSPGNCFFNSVKKNMHSHN